MVNGVLPAADMVGPPLAGFLADKIGNFRSTGSVRTGDELSPQGLHVRPNPGERGGKPSPAPHPTKGLRYSSFVPSFQI